jgi:arylsulfatase
MNTHSEATNQRAGDAAAPEGLRQGDPGLGHQAMIGRTLRQSKPWWRPRREAPKGAPDIVVVLLDDLGFSDFGCYGSEIRTPCIDELAAAGLRWTGYTTVPMCTPARAALFTGKNPHAVGCGWLTHSDPGYPGYQAGEISRDAPTLPELLREQGYATYGVGKWHNVADHNATAGGDRGAWPLQRGFDRFYGFLGAETHFFSPGHLIEGNEFLPVDEHPQDYYSSDDWTNRAIRYLRGHQSAAPAKPLFLYLAHNAPHVPLHARPEDVARYDGVYADGWDAARRRRFERQQAMGLIPMHWRLPGSSPGIRPWCEIPEAERPVMAHYMQLYAAMVDNIDRNLGRLVDELKALGRWDNTLLILTSDNGASSIGGPDGAANIFEKRVTQREDPQLARRLFEHGELGGMDSYPAYPVAWGQVSNTPFRFYKRMPMNGGIRVPFVVSWPSRVREPGALRPAWIHVTDVVPTVLDLLGASYPAQFNGWRTRPLDGTSFATLLDDATVSSRRTRQYIELEGNRGYIHGHWKIVSLQPTGTPIDLDRWMLFDLEADPTECDDLAASRPEVLRELVAAFEADAAANHVYPLDNRDLRRVLTLPPHLEAAFAQPRSYFPGTETGAPVTIAPLLADRDYRIECGFEHPEGAVGVLFAIGDNLNGMAAFVLEDGLHVAFRAGAAIHRHVRLPLAAGRWRLSLRHEAAGQRRGTAHIALEDDASALDSSRVREGTATPEAALITATLDMTPTFLRLGGEGVDVGLDRRRKVSSLYEGRGVFAYGGRIDRVTVTPGPQAPGSFANRPEALAQLD